MRIGGSGLRPEVSPAAVSFGVFDALDYLGVKLSRVAHACGELALTLFVAWVVANHHDAAVATNHSALVTDFLHTGFDLHCGSFFRCLRAHRDL